MNTPQTHEITKGNLRTPLGALLAQGGEPIDLASLTVTFFMLDNAGASVVAESTTGVTKQPTQTFTVDTTENRLICNAHRVQVGQQIVVSNSGGSLPSGLSSATRYFVVARTPNFFKVSFIPNGAPVDITAAGSGTHSFYVVGTVQKEFLAADVDTEGDYWAWFNVEESNEKDTFPVDGRKLMVKIVGAE